MNNREKILLNRIVELESISEMLSHDLDYISLDWVKKNILNRKCLKRKKQIKKIFNE